jgi:hypothetical protein
MIDLDNSNDVIYIVVLLIVIATVSYILYCIVTKRSFLEHIVGSFNPPANQAQLTVYNNTVVDNNGNATTSEPVTTEPVTSEPVASEPVTTEPVASEPVTTDYVDGDFVTDTQSGLIYYIFGGKKRFYAESSTSTPNVPTYNANKLRTLTLMKINAIENGVDVALDTGNHPVPTTGIISRTEGVEAARKYYIIFNNKGSGGIDDLTTLDTAVAKLSKYSITKTQYDSKKGTVEVVYSTVLVDKIGGGAEKYGPKSFEDNDYIEAKELKLADKTVDMIHQPLIPIYILGSHAFVIGFQIKVVNEMRINPEFMHLLKGTDATIPSHKFSFGPEVKGKINQFSSVVGTTISPHFYGMDIGVWHKIYMRFVKNSDETKYKISMYGRRMTEDGKAASAVITSREIETDVGSVDFRSGLKWLVSKDNDVGSAFAIKQFYTYSIKHFSDDTDEIGYEVEEMRRNGMSYDQTKVDSDGILKIIYGKDPDYTVPVSTYDSTQMYYEAPATSTFVLDQLAKDASQSMDKFYMLKDTFSSFAPHNAFYFGFGFQLEKIMSQNGLFCTLRDENNADREFFIKLQAADPNDTTNTDQVMVFSNKNKLISESDNTYVQKDVMGPIIKESEKKWYQIVLAVHKSSIVPTITKDSGVDVDIFVDDGSTTTYYGRTHIEKPITMAVFEIDGMNLVGEGFSMKNVFATADLSVTKTYNSSVLGRIKKNYEMDISVYKTNVDSSQRAIVDQTEFIKVQTYKDDNGNGPIIMAVNNLPIVTALQGATENVFTGIFKVGYFTNGSLEVQMKDRIGASALAALRTPSNLVISMPVALSDHIPDSGLNFTTNILTYPLGADKMYSEIAGEGKETQFQVTKPLKDAARQYVKVVLIDEKIFTGNGTHTDTPSIMVGLSINFDSLPSITQKFAYIGAKNDLVNMNTGLYIEITPEGTVTIQSKLADDNTDAMVSEQSILQYHPTFTAVAGKRYVILIKQSKYASNHRTESATAIGYGEVVVYDFDNPDITKQTANYIGSIYSRMMPSTGSAIHILNDLMNAVGRKFTVSEIVTMPKSDVTGVASNKSIVKSPNVFETGLRMKNNIIGGTEMFDVSTNVGFSLREERQYIAKGSNNVYKMENGVLRKYTTERWNQMTTSQKKVTEVNGSIITKISKGIDIHKQRSMESINLNPFYKVATIANGYTYYKYGLSNNAKVEVNGMGSGGTGNLPIKTLQSGVSGILSRNILINPLVQDLRISHQLAPIGSDIIILSGYYEDTTPNIGFTPYCRINDNASSSFPITPSSTTSIKTFEFKIQKVENNIVFILNIGADYSETISPSIQISNTSIISKVEFDMNLNTYNDNIAPTQFGMYI